VRSEAERVVATLQELANGKAMVSAHRQSPWASITFSGNRHRVELHFAGSQAVIAGERLIECLPDHEFTLPRRIVAQADIIAVEHVTLPQPAMTVHAELLVLEEA
jgi:hypothetical protein